MEGKRNHINDRKSKFIEKANIKFNGKYDYSLVNYIDAKTRVKIICPIHGEFEQTPDKHLSKKHGCPKCASETRKEIFKKHIRKFIIQLLRLEMKKIIISIYILIMNIFQKI